MSEQLGSHTEESHENEDVKAAFEAFSLLDDDDDTPPTPGKAEQESDKSEPPAKEVQPEPKKIKVKHNKEEIEVDVSDEKLPEYVQKALALDKERERKGQLEKNLERAAKLAGFEKVDDYLSNLDKLEQEAQKRQEDQFKTLRQELREEAESAGLDPDKLDAWLDNHPLLQEAQKAVQERQQAEQARVQQTAQEQFISKWRDLYDAYPDLLESAKAFEEGGTPDWYTPEMQSRIERGYDPRDAYELAHKSTLRERDKQEAQRKAIKDQRLGLRSQVETDANGEIAPEVPDALASAFSLFGLNPKAAQKYVKK